MEKAIDRLALDKDNRAYVFRSSLDAYITRYFYGMKHNPGEQARFDRETIRFNRETAKGKFVPSVVPLNLVDLDKVRANMRGTVSGMIDHFSAERGVAADYAAQARALVQYLQEHPNYLLCYSHADNNVSNALRRVFHRWMNENSDLFQGKVEWFEGTDIHDKDSNFHFMVMMNSQCSDKAMLKEFILENKYEFAMTVKNQMNLFWEIKEENIKSNRQ